MVAESWILKMGNQASSTNYKKTKTPLADTKNRKQTIGILSFEVANVMSKTVHLHKSLTDGEISKLKSEISASHGVKTLISASLPDLLRLALAEKLDDLARVAAVVSRLGKKCSLPALQGFEHVFADVTSGAIDVSDLGFLVKDMDAMIKRLDRYVNTTSNLYGEMEVLNELEQATKKFQQNQHEESKKAFEQKLTWQKQDVRQLQEVSLWNQTFDKVVELLARTVCTIYARICLVFGESILGFESNLGNGLGMIESGLLRRVVSRRSSGDFKFNSGLIDRGIVEKRVMKNHVDSRRGDVGLVRAADVIFSCGNSPGRLLLDCLSLSSSASRFDDDDEGIDVGNKDDRSSQILGCCSVGNAGLRREHLSHLGYFNRGQSGVLFGGDRREIRFGPKSRLAVYATPSTVGGAALALHYANVIIVIEKLLRYPHLVGDEARDDLYQMLPTSLRMKLRTNLKSFVKNLAIYDAPLAHDWKETLDGILEWLAPLAHNMIRWQSERNFEQHQIVTRTNVLLLQTLYFADRAKTEAAICELLVGLNYICRYEQQQNALLDCASSFDFEDCMQWQMQCRAAFAD